MVVLICIGSDAVLIVAGVAGPGALFTAIPWLTTQPAGWRPVPAQLRRRGSPTRAAPP